MDNVIDISELRFSYTSKLILDVPTFQLKKSEAIFLHGPSGTGKSTFLNILAGILKANEGKVDVLGNNFSEISERKRDVVRSNHMGYIFQQFNLIPYLSAYDNIVLPLNLKGEHTNKQKIEGVNHLIETLGLTPFIQQKSTTLSIGQQQRVAAARSLVNQPEIILCDEPTSSLDDKNTKNFLELLMKLQDEQKFSLLFVSHDQRIREYFKQSLSLADINKASVL